MSGQTTEDSLSALPLHQQSDTQLTQHLAARYYAHLPTARLSSQALIAFNTYTSPLDGHNGTDEGSAASATKDLASRVWARLGHRQENQAVLFLGESGAGKTTIRSHLLTSLLSFSSTPLSNKLSFAAYVFDSLTTTKSATTPSASKAGLFYELQYDTSSPSHPTLIGGKLLDHRLERSRVSRAPPAGERNFHILYYLVQGASAKDQDHLGLQALGNTAHGVGSRASLGQKKWRYLGHNANMKAGIHDEEGFKQFQYALRKLEFPVTDIAEICQILAIILHLGQLEFYTTSDTTPAGNDSGGYSHEGGENVTRVKNAESLKIIEAFLGVSEQDLETMFAYKTRTLHKERVTVMLDPAGAQSSADELARTLYALLVAWIIEAINKRVCVPDEQVQNTISIVDFPGFAKQASSSSQILDQLLNNAATEQLYNITLSNFFERQVEMLDTEEVPIPPTSYFDNSDAVRGMLKPGNGLLSILDDQSKRGKTDHQFLEAARRRFQDKNPAISVGSSTTVMPGSNFATHNAGAVFTVRHYAGEVDYPIEGLVDANQEVISGDMLNMIGKTRSHFVRELFGQEVLNKVVHPTEQSAVMQATIASKPTRKPSMARKKHDRQARAAARQVIEEDSNSDPESRTSTFVGGRGGKSSSGAQPGVASQFLSSLQAITTSLSAPHTNNYFVFCMKSNDKRMTNNFDVKSVRQQLQTFGIVEISQRLRNADFTVFMPFGDFLQRAEGDAIFVGSDREKCHDILEQRRWPANEARCGVTGVFLSERCWLEIADISSVQLPPRTQYVDAEIDDDGMTPGSRGFGGSNVHLVPGQSPRGYYSDDKAGNYFGVSDGKSEAGASAINGDMFRNLETRSVMAEKANEKAQKLQSIEEHQVSGSRKRWMFFVWALTFYIPNFMIKAVARRKRKDMQTAWREKLAINLHIWLSIASVMFFMVGFPELICPRQDVFTMSELTSYNGKGSDAYVAVRGVVYSLDAIAPRHYPSIVATSALLKYAGKDATNLFPVQVSALCNGKDGTVDPAVQLSYRSSNYSDSKSAIIGQDDQNARYHDFRWFRNDSRADWWWEQQYTMKHNYQKGSIGFPPDYVKKLAGQRQSVAILHNKVYDFTEYNRGGRTPQYGSHEVPDTPPDSEFMDSRVVSLFTTGAGSDVSKFWDNLDIDPALKNRMQVCLDNLFYVGKVDTRSSTQCLFAKYILLAISIMLCTVIGVKFLAALQFGKKNVPENLDKFVICTVPAYTEDEDSLRRAIDSAARMRYDDKRKLLLIICDGMIVGQGNDRPTPRIVLDILGVSDTIDPEPLSFESLGEGQKQHNMGKIYSGLYEVQGHIVPFLVVVKVGKPSEVQKPGNRGKRDSQMILMRFLNRVHYNLPMTPMELEMHHQIRNIIGVNPTFYEFTLQIDADTVVAPDSATRMIAAMTNDTGIIGVCGETALTNAKQSAVTAIQVYEYYISHNLTKAFESLFGSVTCLPGCFTMYRIRAADTGKPLFVSKEVVDDYSEIRVDTLHMKNLLHLGEDRYLTTLLLKYHSKYKTKYIFRAHAWTVAPDSWSIFLSQRRRWINSTVHNLIELMPLQQLCGFCCFSMRFIVFIDLLSTIVQPTIVGYITYLIYLVVKDSSVVPITAFILLGAIYGLQAIIFILRRKWEMIGWMIIYILATPVFACALPLYSFWHMDDFSWGNTRIVTGEKGQKVVISDEGKFDPASIPKKRWEDYQAELWEAQTQHDTQSEASGYSYATKTFPQGSIHGGSPWQRVATPGSDYANIPPSRPMSTLDIGRASSRMSIAPSQMMGPTAGSEFYNMEMDNINYPSDDMILAEIRSILATADMMQTSKKTVKEDLSRRFSVDMTPKMKFIGYCVESIIGGTL